MLDWSLDHRQHPVAIRVPGAGVVSNSAMPLPHDYDEVRYQVVRDGSQVAILALGTFFELGTQIADALAQQGIDATLINPRFASQLDEGLLQNLAGNHSVVITLEDGVLDGGWGEKVARYLAPASLRTRCYGLPGGFPDRYDANDLLREAGITVEAIVSDVHALMQLRKNPCF